MFIRQTSRTLVTTPPTSDQQLLPALYKLQAAIRTKIET